MESSYASQVWNIKEGAPICSHGGANTITSALFKTCSWKRRIPSSPCHENKMDTWRGRLPQTLWQSRQLPFVSQYYQLWRSLASDIYRWFIYNGKGLCRTNHTFLGDHNRMVHHSRHRFSEQDISSFEFSFSFF